MKLGAYELLERIAVGGMAEVYRGRAVGEGGFEKQVAIKRILPHLASDTRFVGMLVQEARIHAGLSHRNIVQIHDLGLSDGGEYFIVLEYVDGRDLGALLNVMSKAPPPGNRLADAVALHVAIELGEGIHCAHQLASSDGRKEGLVHRDISPSNVLVSYAGEVKLSDFGLAKRQTDHSVVGSLKGKLAYMSPEQARRWPLDRRSDIFSLGAVLFELLTGRRLRDIDDEAEGWRLVASGVMSKARSVRPDIPAVLERLLDRALAPDPQDRFQDASVFVAAARDALAQLPRPRSGEAAELQGALRSFLPPGAPRPEQPPSRVIRLQSQVLGQAEIAIDMGITRPALPRSLPRSSSQAPTGFGAPEGHVSDRTAAGAWEAGGLRAPGMPPPRAPEAASGETRGRRPTLRGTPPVPFPQALPADVPPSRPASAPLSAFPAPPPGRPLGAMAQGRSPASLAARVPADDLVPVSGELASPARQDRPVSPAVLALQLPTPGAHGLPVLSLPGGGGGAARAAFSQAVLADSLAALDAAAARSRRPELSLGTPGLDPAALTPRFVSTGAAGVWAKGRIPGRVRHNLWALLLGLLCAAALGVHVFVTPLGVLLRWWQPAKLVVQSVPEGAQVTLDGELLAAPTPTFVTIDRDRKDHVITLTKQGFEPFVGTVRLDRAVRLSVKATLTALPGLQFEKLPEPPEAPAPAEAMEPDPLAPAAAAAALEAPPPPKASLAKKKKKRRKLERKRARR
ncbi:MAG: protein kinase [Myxococcales bacterium]|nr:protein kinase [Myxococcales bacterium]